jgi:hypothetical protein
MATSIPLVAMAAAVKAARAHPKLAVALASVAAIALRATRKSSQWAAARQTTRDALQALQAEILERTENRFGDSVEAKAQLARYRVEHRAPQLPVADVARTLAIGPPTGLGAGDLYAVLGHRFAVRPLLEGHPRLFIRSGGRRWLLGSPAGLPPAVV